MKIVKTAACQPINLFELDERHSTLRPCNLVINGSWRSIILQQQQQQLWKKYALHSAASVCARLQRMQPAKQTTYLYVWRMCLYRSRILCYFWHSPINIIILLVCMFE